MKGLVTFIGRLGLVTIFGWGAYDYITNWHARVAMLADQIHLSSQWNWAAQVLLGGAAAFLAIGTVTIVLGLFARWGALLIALFLIPTTLLFHSFWNYAGVQYFDQLAHFYKNVGLFGGMLLLVGMGPGPWSFDCWWSTRKARRHEHFETPPSERPL